MGRTGRVRVFARDRVGPQRGTHIFEIRVNEWVSWLGAILRMRVGRLLELMFVLGMCVSDFLFQRFSMWVVNSPSKQHTHAGELVNIRDERKWSLI